MTLIVVGVSHRSASFDLLDRVALGEDGARDLLDTVVASDHVAEALVLSTCNRVEVYADVDRFHGSVEDVTEMLAKQAGLPVAEFAGYAYVHYDERAVHHMFTVASGLDSMVTGEQQIVGQVRSALRQAQELGTAGRVIHASPAPCHASVPYVFVAAANVTLSLVSLMERVSLTTPARSLTGSPGAGQL